MNRAKSTFNTFCQRMAKGDLEKAALLTQKTWRSSTKSPETALTTIADKVDWRAVKYRTAKEIGKAAVDIKFDSLGYTYLLRMVCEKEPFRPSLWGSWGVNPLSLRQRKNDAWNHSVK